MSTVLILTVGTTADPLLKAVEEHHVEDPSVSVLVVYGRPFPNQDPSPFDVAVEVRQRALELGLRAETREVPDPEDIDVCLQVARSVLREAVNADRVVVDFTGGTKAIAAAMVHAALTEHLSGQLMLRYTGGSVRDAAGRVSGPMVSRRNQRTATEELLRQVLTLLQKFAYREARILAQLFPDSGRAGFVRRAVEILYAWDEFNYEAAVESLGELYGAACHMRDVAEVGHVAGLLCRLREPGDQLEGVIRELRELQEGADGRCPPLEATALLVADALENAARRLREERPTDCVLRAYRAVESAVQAWLLSRGVNPWKPDWGRLEEPVLDRYLAALGQKELPRELALGTGLRLVESLGRPLPDHLQKRLQDLQRNRNRSYLEHGYQRIDSANAKRLLGYAEEVCAHILNMDMNALRGKVAHSF